MPDGKGHMREFVVDNSVPAWKNKDFLTGFSHMMMVSRRQSEWSNEHEYPMIQHAMKLSNVTCLEVYRAFWKAFSDPYQTKAGGVEWKHIWKYINAERSNRFTYDEMEEYCTENGVSSDVFRPVVRNGKTVYWKLLRKKK